MDDNNTNKIIWVPLRVCLRILTELPLLTPYLRRLLDKEVKVTENDARTSAGDVSLSFIK